MVSENYLEDMKSQRFGVEIEFSFITRPQAREVIRQLLSNHDMLDGNGRKWNIVRDSSITPRKRAEDGSIVFADDNYKVELNTPLLGYGDMGLLLDIVDALKRKGAEASNLCGIHIHVSEEGHTVRSLRNLLNLFMQKEDVMCEAFQIDDARKARYCKEVCAGLIAEINRRKPATLEKLKCQWNDESCGRYRMLNLESFYSNKGIEFRLFNSTLDAATIRAYIVFCLAVSHKAKTMHRAVPVKSSLENNRYDWRNFLNRLGLAGDEFKLVRRVLMRHVSGDSAFHEPESHGRTWLSR